MIIEKNQTESLTYRVDPELIQLNVPWIAGNMGELPQKPIPLRKDRDATFQEQRFSTNRFPTYPLPISSPRQDTYRQPLQVQIPEEVVS